MSTAVRKKATMVAVLITLVAALIAAFTGPASAAPASVAAKAASGSCGKVPNQRNYTKSQIASFEKAAKKQGFSAKQIAIIERCKAEYNVATSVTLTGKKVKLTNPGSLIRHDSSNTAAARCASSLQTWTATAKNLVGATAMSFTVTTDTCHRVSHGMYQYYSPWSKAANDQHIRPHVAGWNILWDYVGLASFGNYQMYDSDGDWTVARTGNFEFKFGIGSFAVTHHTQLEVTFDYGTDGYVYMNSY